MRLLSVLLGVGLVLGLTVFVTEKVNQQEQKTAADVGVRILPGGIVVPPDDPAAVIPKGGVGASEAAVAGVVEQRAWHLEVQTVVGEPRRDARVDGHHAVTRQHLAQLRVHPLRHHRVAGESQLGP